MAQPADIDDPDSPDQTLQKDHEQPRTIVSINEHTCAYDSNGNLVVVTSLEEYRIYLEKLYQKKITIKPCRE